MCNVVCLYKSPVYMWRMCDGFGSKMLAIAVLLSSVVSVAVSKNYDVQLFCPSHNPQKTFNFQALMGKWYVVEIVDHLPKEGLRRSNVMLPLCPEVELMQEDYSNVKILWKEDYYTSYYYHAKRSDMRSPGFWTASGPNTRFFLDFERHNEHFKGTIEVMKAVHNHIVLTFCTSDDRNGQLFSAVLSKDKWLPRADIIGVNEMLPTRNLMTHRIKHTCNGAATLTATLAVLISAIVWLL